MRSGKSPVYGNVIGVLDTGSIRSATKASRRFGLVAKECEHLGFWNNSKTRDLICNDVSDRNGLPHYGNPQKKPAHTVRVFQTYCSFFSIKDFKTPGLADPFDNFIP